MNTSIYSKRDTTELNVVRTAILTSNRFRKWRQHIQSQLRELHKIQTSTNNSK